MTIQNIDDVMDRIMSLNRNLTEDSLKVLLSASGWDREDISEGLRIFRSKNKNTVRATPTVNSVTENTENSTEKEETSDTKAEIRLDNVKSNLKQETNPYTFNLKREANQSEVEHEDIISPSVEKMNTDNNSQQINQTPSTINQTSTIPTLKSENKKDNPFILQDEKKITSLATPLPVKVVNNNAPKTSHNLGKLIFFILLFLILGIVGAYFFYPKFTNYVNANFSNSRPALSISENPKINNTIPVNNIPTNNLDNTNQSNQNDPAINQLRNDINSLKQEFYAFKATPSESKTIVKYISQRGPAGRDGRGIYKVEASENGFAIYYTDGNVDMIPYSTTTRVNTLNAKEVCFRNNATSTEIMYNNGTNTNNISFDICLDQNAILNILQK